MIIELGEVSFTAADSKNIPVNISVHLVNDSDVWASPELSEYKGWWMAVAANYTPRKECVYSDAYMAVCPSRGELVAHVQQHARPLYQYALNAIDDLDQTNEDGYSGLEYWG
jgi:hypothetical protein